MSYTWRDPARVTPARLAELEARDRPEPLSGGERTAAAAAMKARIRQFARLRAAGYRISETAREMGISRDTARAYDRARRQP